LFNAAIQYFLDTLSIAFGTSRAIASVYTDSFCDIEIKLSKLGNKSVKDSYEKVYSTCDNRGPPLSISNCGQVTSMAVLYVECASGHHLLEEQRQLQSPLLVSSSPLDQLALNPKEQWFRQQMPNISFRPYLSLHQVRRYHLSLIVSTTFDRKVLQGSGLTV